MKNIFVILGTLLLILVLAYVFHINRVTREGLLDSMDRQQYEQFSHAGPISQPSSGYYDADPLPKGWNVQIQGPPELPQRIGWRNTNPGTEPPTVNRDNKPRWSKPPPPPDGYEIDPTTGGYKPVETGTQPVEPGTIMDGTLNAINQGGGGGFMEPQDRSVESDM